MVKKKGNDLGMTLLQDAPADTVVQSASDGKAVRSASIYFVLLFVSVPSLLFVGGVRNSTPRGLRLSAFIVTFTVDNCLLTLHWVRLQFSH
jgi:hypothetical protein